MALNIHVYRSDLGDCTNGGISATARQLCIVNAEGPEHVQPSDDAPAAMIVKHAPFGEEIGRRLVRIVPAVRDGDGWKPDPRWLMFGGNYGACSDSRIRELVEGILGVFFYGAIPIHDRFEA